MQGNVGCRACDPRQSCLHVWNADTAHSGWGPCDLGLCCLCQALLSTFASDSLPFSHVSVCGMLSIFQHCWSGGRFSWLYSRELPSMYTNQISQLNIMSSNLDKHFPGGSSNVIWSAVMFVCRHIPIITVWHQPESRVTRSPNDTEKDLSTRQQ